MQEESISFCIYEDYYDSFLNFTLLVKLNVLANSKKKIV